MKTCGTCKFYGPETMNCDVPTFFGHCNRWAEGYHVSIDKLKSNDVLVENDEGWGNMVGQDFGCVLHEPKNH